MVGGKAIENRHPQIAQNVENDVFHPVGKMTVRLDPAPPAPSFVVISENWYPDWRATVDGQPAPALRGNYTLLAVPVPAGAREVALEFSRGAYSVGKVVTLLALLGALALAVVPAVARRRRVTVG